MWSWASRGHTDGYAIASGVVASGEGAQMMVPAYERFVTGLAAAVLIAAVTAVGYLGWLGWDRHKSLRPDGHVSGPYQLWHVIGLAITVGAVAVVAGRHGHPVAAVLGITVMMTICFSVDATTEAYNDEARNDGLWPVGAVLVAIGTFLGIALVTGLAYAFRARVPKDRLARSDR